MTITKPDGTVLKIYNFGEVRNPLGSGFKCTKTDDNGNAVFELQGSPALTADVIANFTDEGLARHIDVAPGGGTVADNPPLSPAAILAGGSATTGPGSNGTGSPTASEIQSVIKAAIAGGFGVIATPAVTTNTNTINPKITATKTIKTRMLIMRLVRPAHGKPYFLVKVQSAHKTAKITISLKNSHGKTIGKITKTIATNKQVKIQSSLIKLSVHKGGLLSVK